VTKSIVPKLENGRNVSYLGEMVLVTKSIVPKLENGRNVSTPNQVQSLKRKCIEKYVILFKLKPGV
jgi:hypothetical protein